MQTACLPAQYECIFIFKNLSPSNAVILTFQEETLYSPTHSE